MGCQLFNNRKCGNKKKCLQTQEDAWQEKTGAKPRRDKFSSLKLGGGKENDTCEEAAAGVGGGDKPRHPRMKSADGKGEGRTSTTKGQ